MDSDFNSDYWIALNEFHAEFKHLQLSHFTEIFVSFSKIVKQLRVGEMS